MPTIHEIVQGECLSSIAEQYGHFIPTIWDHPKNRELRDLRGNPHVLLPGDKVFVPDKRAKDVACATGRRHTFRRRGVPEKFRIQFLDEKEEPRANLPYVFEIAGRRVKGKTDSSGWIDQWVPNGEKFAVLRLGEDEEEEYQVRLGSLDPANVESGARARLASLGYLDDEDGEAEEYASALATFQAEYGDPVTATLDRTTISRLREAYGS